MCFWNGKQIKLGKAWDVGDVLGIGIDIECNSVEYFINGVSIGILTVDNIGAGPNQAFFPAVTIHTKEKCIVNTGTSRLAHKYKSSKSNE